MYLISFITFLFGIFQTKTLSLSNWISLNTFKINFGLTLNWEFYVCFLIWSIALLILIYSLDYIKDSLDFTLFYYYLSFFTTSISIIVVSSDIFTLLVGWECVGISSYLLINFWNLRTLFFVYEKAFIKCTVILQSITVHLLTSFLFFTWWYHLCNLSQ